MTRIFKLVLIACGLLLWAAYPAYAAGSLEIQPYFESGEGINDASGLRYKFYVAENESRDSLKAIRGLSRFKGSGSTSYLIETGIYSEGLFYPNESCADQHSLTGEISQAEASLRIGLPYSLKSSLPGIKSHNPAAFPKITYETENKDQSRAELVSQFNLNGKQGMVEIVKGEGVTDKSGWLCEKDLEDIDYIQWNITASIDSEERTMSLALPKDTAVYLASMDLLNLQAESLHSSGAFKVYYWDIEVKCSNGQWASLDKWIVSSYDGSLTDYGARKAKYDNKTVIEISNDESQGEFFKEREVFSLKADEDNSPPSGSLSINSGADYANAKDLTLSLTAQDDTGITGYYLSEVPEPSAKDKQGWASLSSVTGYNAAITYSLKEENIPAAVTLYVWYKDAAGNISETASDSISFDLIAPSLTITSPTTASTFNTKEASLTLSGTAADNASGVEKITYASAQGSSGTASGTNNWTISGIILSKGENVFSITAYDKLNNSVQTTFTANCEIVEPPGTPVFSQKYDGKTVSSGSLSWSWGPAESGGAIEEYLVSPSWLPNGFSTKEASYSLTKKLSKGTYQISIMAKNSAGISKKAKDTIVIIEESGAEETSNSVKEKTASTADIEETDNTNIKTASAETKVSQDDQKTDSPAESKDTNTSKKETSAASDNYGAPAGNITIEYGNSCVNSKKVKINLLAADDNGITGYYLSDSSDTPSDSDKEKWVNTDKNNILDRDIDYELKGPDGDKNIYVWFRNSLGRISSGHSESITLDTKSPEIESFEYDLSSDSTAELRIKINDENSGASSLSWKNNNLSEGKGTYSKTRQEWIIEDLPLYEGDNEITLTAQDEAGNMINKTINITYSPSADPEGNKTKDDDTGEKKKEEAEEKEEENIRKDISDKFDFIKDALNRKDSEINGYFDSAENWDKFLEYNGYIYAACRQIKAFEWDNSTPLTEKERKYLFENFSGIIKNTSFLKKAAEAVNMNTGDESDNLLGAAIRELLYLNLISIYPKSDDFLSHKNEIAASLGLKDDKSNIISRLYYDFDAFFILEEEEYEAQLLEKNIYLVLEKIPSRGLYSRPLAITSQSYAVSDGLLKGKTEKMASGRINAAVDLNLSDVFYQINRNIWDNLAASEKEEDKNRITKAYSLIQQAGLIQNNYLRNYSKSECDQCGPNSLFKDTDEEKIYCFNLDGRIKLESGEINGCGLLTDKGESKYCVDLDNLKSEQEDACSDNCANCFITYIALPEEFFPHIALSWINTAQALGKSLELLGDEDSFTRYYGPINQFLFFADVYSQGKNKVKIYELDQKNTRDKEDDALKTRDAALERDDESGLIKSITIDDLKYEFSRDGEGNVSGYTKTNGDKDYRPIVFTSVASEKTHNSAKLRGTVNANGLSTEVKFEYGTASGSYDYSIASDDKVSSSEDTVVSVNISGLSPDTTYYYRIFAENNSAGTSAGEEKEFWTEAETVILED